MKFYLVILSSKVHDLIFFLLLLICGRWSSKITAAVEVSLIQLQASKVDKNVFVKKTEMIPLVEKQLHGFITAVDPGALLESCALFLATAEVQCSKEEVAPLSPLLALAGDLHTFLWEALEGNKKVTNSLSKVWAVGLKACH